MVISLYCIGRRGVFDGTVENMHLHWKYRELVKLICKEKSIEAAYQVARTLQAESGGILVSVERVRKGYAIIMYRGKNYERPACIRPKTLLSKRAAMKRSLEAQRREVNVYATLFSFFFSNKNFPAYWLFFPPNCCAVSEATCP